MKHDSIDVPQLLEVIVTIYLSGAVSDTLIIIVILSQWINRININNSLHAG